jgi:acetate kinase
MAGCKVFLGDAMHILVINSGSSSVKFSVFEADEGKPHSLFEGEVSGVGGDGAQLAFRDALGNDLAGGRAQVKAGNASEAIHAVMDVISDGHVPAIDAVGYRVVHPGAKLKDHCRITEEVLQDLVAAAEFAPLHDPVAVEMIRAVMARMPGVGHYACFDTVFHESMSEAASTYALPVEVRERGVRRYGFHGLSCESIVAQLREAAERDITGRDGIKFPERMVIAHLGSGCSVTAVVNGRSVDTTMGLTPTGGVVMGTRPGDLDPGVMLYLLRQQGATVDSVEKMVNHAAGMVALSGMANDMRAVREAAANGDMRAKLAIAVFTRSIRKAIGGFCWLMGGLDAIVFAGGIGEHDDRTRDEILSRLEGLGVELDAWLDGKGEGVRLLSETSSRVAVYVAPAEEDRMIAMHVMNMTAR